MRIVHSYGSLTRNTFQLIFLKQVIISEYIDFVYTKLFNSLLQILDEVNGASVKEEVILFISGSFQKNIYYGYEELVLTFCERVFHHYTHTHIIF